MGTERSRIYVDYRRRLVVIEETLDDAEAHVQMLPPRDGLTRDFWRRIEELRTAVERCEEGEPQ